MNIRKQNQKKRQVQKMYAAKVKKFIFGFNEEVSSGLIDHLTNWVKFTQGITPAYDPLLGQENERA